MTNITAKNRRVCKVCLGTELVFVLRKSGVSTGFIGSTACIGAGVSWLTVTSFSGSSGGKLKFRSSVARRDSDMMYQLLLVGCVVISDPS